MDHCDSVSNIVTMITKLLLGAVLCLHLNQICSAEPAELVSVQQNGTSSTRDLFAPKSLTSCLSALGMIPYSIVLAIINRYDLFVAAGYIIVTAVGGLRNFFSLLVEETGKNFKVIVDVIRTCTGKTAVSAVFGQSVARSACSDAVKSAGKILMTSLSKQAGSLLSAGQNVLVTVFFMLLFLFGRVSNDIGYFLNAIIGVYIECGVGGKVPPLLGFLSD